VIREPRLHDALDLVTLAAIAQVVADVELTIEGAGASPAVASDPLTAGAGRRERLHASPGMAVLTCAYARPPELVRKHKLKNRPKRSLSGERSST
jgi:hypothetical protein